MGTSFQTVSPLRRGRAWYFASTATACCIAAFIGWETATPPGRLLQVDDAALDLGPVWPEPAVTRSVRIHNATRKDIQIRGFAVSCSCLTITPESLAVGAGADAAISISADLRRASRAGANEAADEDLRLQIVPVLEGAYSPQAPWYLRAVVRRLISFDPPYCTLWDGLVAGRPLPVFRTTIRGLTPLASISARCDPKWGATHIQPKADGKYILELSINPKLPIGRFAFEAIIEPHVRGEQTKIEIPLKIVGEMHSPVLVQPTVVDFGRLPIGELRHETVTIQLADNRPFTMTGAAANTSEVTMEPTTTGTGNPRVYTVYCRLVREGSFKCEVHLTMRTGAGIDLSYSLPIYGYGVPATSQKNE